MVYVFLRWPTRRHICITCLCHVTLMGSCNSLTFNARHLTCIRHSNVQCSTLTGQVIFLSSHYLCGIPNVSFSTSDTHYTPLMFLLMWINNGFTFSDTSLLTTTTLWVFLDSLMWAASFIFGLVAHTSQLLEPARHVQTLTEFAMKEGFAKNLHGDRMVRVGVDVRYSLLSFITNVNWLCSLSIWICQAQAVVHSMRGPGTREGENPALRIILFRICHLLARCIEPIFIFNGPGHPPFKRGMNVKSGKLHWMEQYIEGFLEDFGCSFYHVASTLLHSFVPYWQWCISSGSRRGWGWVGPADCMPPNQNGHHNGFQCFPLWGHKHDQAVSILVMYHCLYANFQSPNVKGDGDEITCYSADDIERDTSLTQSKLIFLAILSGGDYDEVGGQDTELEPLPNHWSLRMVSLDADSQLPIN